jgi:hypothetical protein
MSEVRATSPSEPFSSGSPIISGAHPTLILDRSGSSYLKFGSSLIGSEKEMHGCGAAVLFARSDSERSQEGCVAGGTTTDAARRTARLLAWLRRRGGKIL